MTSVITRVATDCQNYSIKVTPFVTLSLLSTLAHPHTHTLSLLSLQSSLHLRLGRWDSKGYTSAAAPTTTTMGQKRKGSNEPFFVRQASNQSFGIENKRGGVGGRELKAIIVVIIIIIKVVTDAKTCVTHI